MPTLPNRTSIELGPYKLGAQVIISKPITKSGEEEPSWGKKGEKPITLRMTAPQKLTLTAGDIFELTAGTKDVVYVITRNLS